MSGTGDMGVMSSSSGCPPFDGEGRDGKGPAPTSGGFVRVKRVRMVGFRSFQDYALDIPPGLVFICGPNESGKTGIMEAIRLGLFTDAATTRQDVQGFARWGTGEGFRIELTLETQEGLWEITRDFHTRRNGLKRPDGTVERDKNRILETVAGLLGIPAEGAEAAYTASVCVLQDELASGGDHLEKLIENRVVGAGVDVVKLAQDADRQMRELRAGRMGGSRQGELTRAQIRVSELEKKLNEVRSRVSTGQEARIRVVKLTEEAEKLTGQVALLGQTLEKARRYAAAQETCERESKELNDVFNQIMLGKELEKQLAGLTPEIRGLSETRERLSEQWARRRRFDEIERELAGVRQETSGLGGLRKTVAGLLDEAKAAEKELQSLPPIDPEKVRKAFELDGRLQHQKADLQQAMETRRRLVQEKDVLEAELHRKSREEEGLVRLLEARKRYESVRAVLARLNRLDPAIRQYKESRDRLGALVPVCGDHVREAVGLSAEIRAMREAPAGLDLQVELAHGVGAQLGVDEGLLQGIEPGLTRLSARKSLAVKVPQVIDVQVCTADAEEFFGKVGEAQGKLDGILQVYGVGSVQALSAAYDEYRNAEAAAGSSGQGLAALLAEMDMGRVDMGSGHTGQVGTGSADAADLLAAASQVADALGARAQSLDQAMAGELAGLAMTLEELEARSVAAIEEALEGVRRQVRSVSQNLAGLDGSIGGLEVDKKEGAIRIAEGSIAGLVREAGCESLDDMVTKSGHAAGLEAKVRDRRSRARDLLGDRTLEALDKQVGDLGLRIGRLEEEKGGLLAKGSLPDDLEDKLRKADEELKSKESERDRILGRLSGMDPEDLQRKQSAILARLVPAQQELEKTLHYKMSPDEIVGKEQDLAAKQERLQQLREDRFRAQATVDVVAEGAEDVAGVEEELEDARRQLDHIEREIGILEVLKEVFPEARTRAVSGIFSLLSKASSSYIGLMTDGKYDRMEISEDFSPMLYSDARGELIDGRTERHLLSAGTSDQVLLSVRLAVADLMSQGRRPPVIMDDPFVHFDPVRRQAGIEALKRIAGAYQVIVFTCHDYPEMAIEQKVRLA